MLDLTEPIDVYSEWIDKCEWVNDYSRRMALTTEIGIW